MRIAPLLSGLALTLAALTAQADGIYKWTDENGVTHFGSQPPQKEEVEVVKKPKSERMKQWQAQQQALKAEKAAEEPTSEERSTAAAPQAPQEPKQEQALTKAQQAVRAQRCRMAQGNLQELTTHNRVRELGPDGKMRVLGEEERQQRIRQSRQTIESNC